MYIKPVACATMPSRYRLGTTFQLESLHKTRLKIWWAEFDRDYSLCEPYGARHLGKYDIVTVWNSPEDNSTHGPVTCPA